MSPVSPASEPAVFAPAKINLTLNVGDKRADGFHDLSSLVAFADIGDTVQIAPTDGLSLAVEGPFAEAGLGGEDNLILKAARAFAAKTGHPINAHFTLTKNLPVASGIGGGSADAAAALRALARLFPDTAEAVLSELAASIGSDVPVCLLSKPAIMQGRGEQIAPLSAFPPVPVLLVNPRVEVSTAEVFRRLKTRTGTNGVPPMAFKDQTSLVRYLRTTRNDLEPPAREIAPVIGEVLDELTRMPGVALARMSGSGATCFGIFDNPFEAELAATAMAHSHPDWWVKPAMLAKA